MSAPMAELIETVTTVEGTNVKTHAPVMASLYPRPAALKSLALRDPPTIPLERVYGPIPPPPSRWKEAQSAADALCRFAREGGDDSVARSRLDELYSLWADLAERELCDITGTVIPKFGCRGSGPSLTWKSILPERNGKPGAQKASRTAAWSWIADIVRDTARMCPGGGGDDLDDGACDEGRALGRALLQSLREEATLFGGTDGMQEAMREATRLIRRGMRLCQAERDGRRRYDRAWLGDLQSLEAALRGRADEGKAEDRREAAEKWREWVRLGVRKGARNAHLVSRLPQEWRPSTAELPDGRLTADPAAVLEGQRNKYSRIWAAAETPRRYAWTRREALERLGPSELREAASMFRLGTASTFDGFACRHYAMLSDEALTVTGALLEACELLSTFPSQVRLVTTPLLEKPKGGHRPIAVYPSIYRLWAKARRTVTQGWEARHPRSYFSAAAGNGPADTVWRQQVKQESNVMTKGTAVSILWDLEAFFERIDRQRLYRRAAATGFPLPVLRLALDMYSAPKVLVMGKRIAREVWPTAGVGAGCGIACTLVKLYTLLPMDALMARLPKTVDVDLHVDDFCVSCLVDDDASAIRDMTTAINLIKEMIEDELGATISLPKAALVSSSKHVADRLRATFGTLAGPVCQAAVNLGIDSSAGKRRGARGTGTMRGQRIGLARRRKKRLRLLANVIGRDARKIFVSGVGPSSWYHAAVQGLTDTEVKQVRRVAAAAMPPRSRIRSLTTVNLWHHMPTAPAEVAAAAMFAKAVWSATLLGPNPPRYPGFDLPGLRAAWQEVQDRAHLFLHVDKEDQAKRREWGLTRGPIAAAILELDRVRWKAVSPFEWLTDEGVTVNLTETPPSLMKDYLVAAVQRQAERDVGQKWAVKDTQFAGRRVCFDAALDAMKRDRRLTPMQKGAFTAVVTGGVMTNQRAAQSGYDVADVCPLCGEPGDSIFHRAYMCSHTRERVKAAVPEWFWRETQRAPQSDSFWTTAAFPHPSDVIPPPSPDYLPWAFDDQGLRIDVGEMEGNLFVDGSCTRHVVKGMQRAALAVVEVDSEARPRRTLSVPLWSSLPQTSQAAEYAAFAAVAWLAKGPSVVYGDCKGVLDLASKPAPLRFSAKKKYAGVLLSMNRCIDGVRNIAAMVKVRAHQHHDRITCPVELWKARSNDLADAAAKAAVERHPKPSLEQQAQIDYWLKRAPLVVRAVATAMAEFPPAGGRLRRRSREGARGNNRDEGAADASRHKWVYAGDRWRCANCWSYVLGGGDVPGKRRDELCKKHRVTEAMRDYERKGHSMIFVDGDLPFAVCSRCGGWSSRRAYRLKQRCGPPTTAGAAALRRIELGQHPWRAKDHSTGGEKPRGRVTPRAAWNAGKGEWRTRRGGRDHGGVHDGRQNTSGGRKRCLDQAWPCRGDLACEEDQEHPEDVAIGIDALDDDYDVFGHGGSLDQASVSNGPSLGDGAGSAKRRRVDTTELTINERADVTSDEAPRGRDPRLQGVTMSAVIKTLVAVLDKTRDNDRVLIHNSLTDEVVCATVASIEAERDHLRSLGVRDNDEVPGRGCGPRELSRPDGEAGPRPKVADSDSPPRSSNDAMGHDSCDHPIGEDELAPVSSRKELLRRLGMANGRCEPEPKRRRCESGDRARRGRENCARSVSCTQQARAGGDLGAEGDKNSLGRLLQACGLRQGLSSSSWERPPSPGAAWAGMEFDLQGSAARTVDAVGASVGDAHGFQADVASHGVRVVACVGPRGAAVDDVTATVPTVAVALYGRRATPLDLDDFAREAAAERGEVAQLPIGGCAAPPRNPTIEVSLTHGRVSNSFPQVMPVAEGGGGPPARRVSTTPQVTPSEDLAAGARQCGRELSDRTRWRPAFGRTVRRRDGNDPPLELPTAARGSGGAAVQLEGMQLRRPRSCAHLDGVARQSESSINHQALTVDAAMAAAADPDAGGMRSGGLRGTSPNRGGDLGGGVCATSGTCRTTPTSRSSGRTGSPVSPLGGAVGGDDVHRRQDVDGAAVAAAPGDDGLLGGDGRGACPGGVDGPAAGAAGEGAASGTRGPPSTSTPRPSRRTLQPMPLHSGAITLDDVIAPGHTTSQTSERAVLLAPPREEAIGIGDAVTPGRLVGGSAAHKRRRLSTKTRPEQAASVSPLAQGVPIGVGGDATGLTSVKKNVSHSNAPKREMNTQKYTSSTAGAGTCTTSEPSIDQDGLLQRRREPP